MAPLTTHCISLLSPLLVLSLLSVRSAGWVLKDTYDSTNFFSDFTFFTAADPTDGWVVYVDEATAESDGLISTSNDQVYMGVDYTNTAPSGRSSVRLTSTATFNHGTLMILDIEHMPEGLGTWPAWWTLGPNWPAGGEIDIIEGVNLQTTNDMTLHTADGCTITNTGNFSGTISTDNCYIDAAGESYNSGCGITTSNTATYGAGFNAVNGGVYALMWTAEYIAVYFWQRSAIPDDITSGAPAPATWSEPLAEFSGGCNIDEFFYDNQIVFDTTFCGDWAGEVWSTSGADLTEWPTCNDYVENNPSAFKDAYWLINSLKVYVSSSNDTSSSTESSDVPATTEASSQETLASLLNNGVVQKTTSTEAAAAEPTTSTQPTTLASVAVAATTEAAAAAAATTEAAAAAAATTEAAAAAATTSTVDDDPTQYAETTTEEGIVGESTELKLRKARRAFSRKRAQRMKSELARHRL